MKSPRSLCALVALAAAGTGLSACYPSFPRSRPEARIYVTDEFGAPLAGATVTLGTMEWHGVVGQNTTEDFVTDREGKVELDGERAWAVQVLLPDGDVRYEWTLCVSKQGFEAIPIWWEIDFDQPIEVAMYPSAVTSRCEWPEDDSYTPRVKEREARWVEVAGGEWQTHRGFAMIVDESIRAAMQASAREQGIKLRSWSEYRFQYQARGDGLRDTRLFVHAICRAPADFDLTEEFFSEPDDNACFFDTTYVRQGYTDQPKAHFEPLQIVAGKG